jgi:hypothetical protein
VAVVEPKVDNCGVVSVDVSNVVAKDLAVPCFNNKHRTIKGAHQAQQGWEVKPTTAGGDGFQPLIPSAGMEVVDGAFDTFNSGRGADGPRGVWSHKCLQIFAVERGPVPSPGSGVIDIVPFVKGFPSAFNPNINVGLHCCPASIPVPSDSNEGPGSQEMLNGVVGLPAI